MHKKISKPFLFCCIIRDMADPVCNLCERKLSEHTYEESIKCAMELIKQGHKKIGMGQHRLRQSMND